MQVYPNFTTFTCDRLSQKQYLFIKESSSCYSLMKKNDESNVKSRDEAQILKDLAIFRDKSLTQEDMNPVTPRFSFFYKSSGVMLYILSDFYQNLLICF